MKCAGAIGFTLFAAAIGLSSRSPLAYGQVSAQKRLEALHHIHSHDTYMCETMPIQQGSSGSELNARGEAKLRGLISNLVDLGASGSAEHQIYQSRVLKEDLAAAVTNQKDCKLRIFKILSAGPDEHIGETTRAELPAVSLASPACFRARHTPCQIF